MLELKNPCEDGDEGCVYYYPLERHPCQRFLVSRMDCTQYRDYQARLDRDKEVWAYIGEWFYEPLINLYLCDEDTKRKVRELWQSLKKGL